MQTFNIKDIYVDEDKPQSEILALSAFENFWTTNGFKCYSTGQNLFGCDTILPIKHKVDREFIHQQNKRQIIKYNILKNSNLIDHNYKVGDKVMLINNAA